MKLLLLPYKATSKGAAAIARTLGIELAPMDSKPKFTEPTRILNWGRGDYPSWGRNANGWINNPQNVMNAIDKGTAFQIMSDHGVPVVQFSTDIAEARRWLVDGAVAVFCRLELQGREGQGIVVARRADQLVPARLYTRHERKKNEYRIHVMNGEVFYSNIKRKKDSAPKDAEELIRSGKQGWYLAHMDNEPSRAVKDAAVAAVRSLGLDFGGVDIGEGDGGVRVYEVNTAPEIGPNTNAAYLRAFKKHYGQDKNNANVRLSAL